MLEKLTHAAERQAANAVTRHVGRLAKIPEPPGITVTATESSITLSGRALRRRMLTDTNLRNFGR